MKSLNRPSALTLQLSQQQELSDSAIEDDERCDLNMPLGEPPKVTQKARQQSMSQLSGTLSASSSLSGSRANTSPTISTQRYKHYHKPTISDTPELVRLCHEYVETGNVAGLARIARTRGLPPALRQYAWPLLLASHPYVLEPSIVVEYPENVVDVDDKIPTRRIEQDISRCRKRLLSSHQTHRKPPPLQRTGGSTPVAVTQISHQHTAFSTPLSTSPSSARADPLLAFDVVSELLSSTHDSQIFDIIQTAIESFLKKWGRQVPYERAMVWVAIGLSEWVNPVFEMAVSSAGDSHSSGDNTSGSTGLSSSSGTVPTTGSNFSSASNVSGGSSPQLVPIGLWESSHAEQFSNAFEHLMLIILHSPKSETAGPSGPYDSPVSERISSFLSILHRLLPALSRHFDEEDIVSGVGDDEWLLWWFRWLGARVFDKHDRGRIWDMYVGWRADTSESDNDDDPLGICPDPFWGLLDCPEATSSPPKELDIYTWHLFISAAILESRAATLMELDSSEIRESLTRVRRADDIEMIILEAGELYRSWQWKEDDDSDE